MMFSRLSVRRSALVVALSTTLLGLGACSDEAARQQSLVPLEIDRSTACELDGMLLADYPGPKAQVFYAGQERPVFFCDTVELFNTLLQGEQVRAVRAVYVQDMGQAAWDEPQGHWIDAKTAFYVASAMAPWAPLLPALPRRQMPRSSPPSSAAGYCHTTAFSRIWPI